MATPPKRRRAPTPWTITALAVIAASNSREIRRNDFELLMHQRGCDARQSAQALASLERRGWAIVDASMLRVSDAGHLAATRSIGLPAAPKKRARRRERMPVGLL